MRSPDSLGNYGHLPEAPSNTGWETNAVPVVCTVMSLRSLGIDTVCAVGKTVYTMPGGFYEKYRGYLLKYSAQILYYKQTATLGRVDGDTMRRKSHQNPYLMESTVFIAPLAFMEIARSRIVMLEDTRKDDPRPAATSAA